MLAPRTTGCTYARPMAELSELVLGGLAVCARRHFEGPDGVDRGGAGAAYYYVFRSPVNPCRWWPYLSILAMTQTSLPGVPSGFWATMVSCGFPGWRQALSFRGVVR